MSIDIGVTPLSNGKTEKGKPEKLKFRLFFVNVDAEGPEAIRVANRQLLILSTAISLALLILALNYALPEWLSMLGRAASWVKSIKNLGS